MNQVDLPILDDSVCVQHFPGYLPNTELCAGYENQAKDWCWVGGAIYDSAFIACGLFIVISKLRGVPGISFMFVVVIYIVF